MTFDAGTWWLLGLLLTGLLGVVGALVTRSVFHRIDENSADIKEVRENYTTREDHKADMDAQRRELEKYPEQDASEVLTRIVSHKLLTALVSKTDEEWNELRADRLLREISGVTRAVAYKKRVDMQNKDVVTAALDEVGASVFSALADEQPELYQKVARFIERKKAEGL